ncbi:wd-40 repeat protein [Stylonychia lemnae]|uniref:Wd-40 repeat protein n=1 Tax=Stylonychia lemnae TaxID=5949 RepID=A0A078AZ70_STYLE|nr:wd-40 repeat protein [Stylonychia lemnae]|eukprot:CDW87439.1 wd-40 repeat protein [Stylonychia lemnae]
MFKHRIMSTEKFRIELRDAKTLSLLQVRELDFIKQSGSAQINEDEKYIAIFSRYQVQIYQLDNLFDQSEPLAVLQSKSIIESINQVFIFDELNIILSYESQNNENFGLLSLNFDISLDNIEESQIIDLDNFFQDLESDIQGNMNQLCISASYDEKFKNITCKSLIYLNMFKQEELIVISIQNECKTYLLNLNNFKVIQELSTIVKFSQDFEKFGVDKEFNLYLINESSEIVQVYKLDQPKNIDELTEISSINFISTKNSYLIYYDSLQGSNLLVYDKFDFSKINEYEFQTQIKSLIFPKDSKFIYGFTVYDTMNIQRIYYYVNIPSNQQPFYLKESDQLQYLANKRYIFQYQDDSIQLFDLRQNDFVGQVKFENIDKKSKIIYLLENKLLIQNMDQIYLLDLDDDKNSNMIELNKEIIKQLIIQSQSIQQVSILVQTESGKFILIVINLDTNSEIYNEVILTVDTDNQNQNCCFLKNLHSERYYIFIIKSDYVFSIVDYEQEESQDFTSEDSLLPINLVNAVLDKKQNIIWLIQKNKIQAFDMNKRIFLQALSISNFDRIENVQIYDSLIIIQSSSIQDSDSFYQNIYVIQNKRFGKHIQLKNKFQNKPTIYESSQIDQVNLGNMVNIQTLNPNLRDQQHNIFYQVSGLRSLISEDNLFKPIAMALYFEMSYKVNISENGIYFYCVGEDKCAGYLDPQFTDIELHKMSDLKLLNNDEIIEELKDLKSYLKFYPGIGNCISVFANKPIILEIIQKQISIFEAKNIPILILPNKYQGKIALDVAIQQSQHKSIAIILDLLIKYQDHVMFNEIVDKHLCKLINLRVDLTDYLQSNMIVYSIIDDGFPQVSQNDQELIVGVQLDHLKDIHNKSFSELIQSQLENNTSGQILSIEYLLLNLQKTLSQNPKNLMISLSKSDANEYFENTVIQTIINFKWQTYSKGYYEFKFYIFMEFVLFFIFEIFYSNYYGKTQMQFKKDSRDFNYIAIIKINNSLVLLYFLFDELRQAIKQSGYFKDIWNLFDISLILSYILLNYVEFYQDITDFILIMQILVVIFASMKLLFFLRIYDGFSFLVSMIGGVFKDLKYFIGFFMIFIAQFGLIFTILFRGSPIQEYEGISSMGYIVMVFRIAAGDFNVENYRDQPQFIVELTWIIWLVAVMVLNVVFMNFIIAVISESYEKVMQKSVAESYRNKAKLIVEREVFFSKKNEKDPYYFPNYILLRRPVNTSQLGNSKIFLLLNYQR